MGINEEIEKIETEFITPFVDELMAKEVPPPNLLIPEKSWKEKKRGELIDIFTGKKDLNRIDAAVVALQADLKSHLSPVELEKLSEEWDHGVEKLNNLPIPTEEETALLPKSLRTLMNISDESFEKYYSTGVRYFQQQDFAKAADVFFLLSLIDYQKHNVWLSLGLSEMKMQQFEPALNAFAMASITNSENREPYLYSAECCTALGRTEESATYLALAKEAGGGHATR